MAPQEKYQREIEEILERAEGTRLRAPRVARPPRMRAGPSFRLSSTHLLLGAVLAILLALGLRGPFLPIFGLTALALLIGLYWMHFTRRASAVPYEKRWRGEPVGPDPAERSSGRIRRWLGRK